MRSGLQVGKSGRAPVSPLDLKGKVRKAVTGTRRKRELQLMKSYTIGGFSQLRNQAADSPPSAMEENPQLPSPELSNLLRACVSVTKLKNFPKGK